MALFHISFYSNTLGMSMQMNVILPQDPKLKNIPVLYLLHGMSDDHSVWLRQTSIERYVSDRNLAVIMPTTHLGWYTDMVHGNKYWTFISEELPNICHSFFPQLSQRREDTFAAGLSMGGYGALKLALARPDRFAAAASLSGALDIKAICIENQQTEERDFWNNIFGDAKDVSSSDNDLLKLAEKITQPKPKIYIWCGTEDFLYHQNITMRDHLLKLNFDLTYEESPGDHQWKYWDAQIQRVLEWFK
jgi:putative tributyrin esterase